jgi:hypothetical protein
VKNPQASRPEAGLLLAWRIGGMFGGARKKSRDDSRPASVPGDSSPKEVYSGLRAHALALKRDEVGIPKPPSDAPIWGLLMEMGYPTATATLLVVSDGTTSLYLSSGGGVLGGHAHQCVRDANAAFLATANQLREQFTPADTCPTPAAGQVIFYALTDSGILTAEAPEEELGSQRHPLSALFYAGHDVLTELRLISERQG